MTEIHLLFIFLFNAFAIIGINRATQYESVNDNLYGILAESKERFWWVRFYSLKYLGENWTKAICGCPKCMATIHGLYGFAYFYLVYSGGDIKWLLFYLMYWPALSGFTHWVNMKILKDEN